MNKDLNEIVEGVLDRKRAHRREWTAIIVSIVLGLLATVVSVWQGWIAQKSLMIALNEQRRAEEALRIAQRPYVAVTAYSPQATTPKGYFRLDVFVAGESPAFNFTVSAGCKVVPSADGLDFASVSQSVLTPKSTHIAGWQSDYLCRIEGFRNNLNDTTVLLGRIEYDDRFGEPHYQNFCYFENRTEHLNPRQCQTLNDGN